MPLGPSRNSHEVTRELKPSLHGQKPVCGHHAAQWSWNCTSSCSNYRLFSTSVCFIYARISSLPKRSPESTQFSKINISSKYNETFMTAQGMCWMHKTSSSASATSCTLRVNTATVASFKRRYRPSATPLPTQHPCGSLHRVMHKLQWLHLGQSRIWQKTTEMQ